MGAYAKVRNVYVFVRGTYYTSWIACEHVREFEEEIKEKY